MNVSRKTKFLEGTFHEFLNQKFYFRPHVCFLGEDIILHRYAKNTKISALHGNKQKNKIN